MKIAEEATTFKNKKKNIYLPIFNRTLGVIITILLIYS